MSRPKIGIYQITNLTNGKVYVGQSWDIEGRWRVHRSSSSSKHLRNAIAKDGIENFQFEILEEGLSDQHQLDTREIWWIDALDSRDPAKGYNKLSGGSYGKHSDETRKKMSDAKKVLNAGSGNPFFGRKHTDEAKRKISENNAFNRPEVRQKAIDALKGKPWPEARRRAHEAKKALKNGELI